MRQPESGESTENTPNELVTELVIARKAAVASAVPSGKEPIFSLTRAKCAEDSAHYNFARAGMKRIA